MESLGPGPLSLGERESTGSRRARQTFSEFRRYDVIGNPVMINAYGEGIPGNGRRFAQGAMVERLMGPRKELQVVVPCGGAGHSKIGAPTATGCCGEQCWGASRVFWGQC